MICTPTRLPGPIPGDGDMTRKSTTTAGPRQRQLRVAELIRQSLSGILARGEVYDPLIGAQIVTVSRVQMSPDLKLATAYIVPLGGKGDGPALVKALAVHAKEMRGRITVEVSLKFAPDLRFRLDETFEKQMLMDRLLDSEKVRRDVEKPAGLDVPGDE